MGETPRAPDLSWLERVPGGPPSTPEDEKGLAMWESTDRGTPAVRAVIYDAGIPQIGSAPYWVVASRPKD